MTFSPMLAIAGTGASGREKMTVEALAGTHIYDLKLDGIRCVAEGGRLFNRNGVDITRKYPEIVAALAECADFERLDGELVALSGKFSDALQRDKQERLVSITRMAETKPMAFVAFDMPTDKLLRTPYWRRREALVGWSAKGLPTQITLSPYSDDPAWVTRVAEQGLEGVIAKRTTSRYQPGKRSADWVKFKNVHRISAMVAGYRPGSGSRSHFGNMQLVLLGEDGATFVEIGDVGTGWTDRQTHELKARLDAGETLIVEIEALNRSADNILRFPVFKGVRTDVTVLDCTVAQLAALPIY
jgi:bifunctional non-homologous end joining protein LigD